MSAPAKDLEIQGCRFRLQRLKPKDALRGLRMVGRVLLPALGEAHAAGAGQIGSALTRVVEGLECLPELLDLFATRTQVPSPTNPEAWVNLPAFLDPTFEGKPDVMVQFLVEAVQNEYGAFLDGKGPLAALMAPKAPSA